MRLHRLHIPFAILIAAFCVYGLLFIYSLSFVVGGERYFSLFDDAMISMRYARNFAEGYGLVWNPGGPAIEGYTNPLWVVFMAAWHLLPIPASKMSLAIQLSALAMLAVNLVIVRRLALLVSGGSALVAFVAVLLTAFYLPLNNWSLQGMEVAALTPLVSMAALLAVQTLQTGRFSTALYILLGIGTLIRMDAVVILLATTLFMAAADGANRLRHILSGFGALALFGGTQTLFRRFYYGEWLPNTYYLKIDGFPLLNRVARGFYVLGWFIASMSVVVFLGAFLMVAVKRSKPLLLLAGLFLAQAAYSVYVGGDAWEWWGGSNRYISIVMPLFLTLLAYSVCHLFARSNMEGWWRRLVDTRPISAAVHLGILLALLLWAAVVSYGGQTVGFPEWGVAIAVWMLLGVVLQRLIRPAASAVSPTNTAPKGRLRSVLAAAALPLVVVMVTVILNTLYVPRGLLELILLKTPVQVHNNPSMVERALVIKETLKPGGSYAVVWAGIIPYFAGGEAIDLLGKNDRYIAHLPMRPNTSAIRPDFYFYPGHQKYDYAYSIEQLQPDAIIQFWSLDPEPPDQPLTPVPWIARPYVDGKYVRADFGNLIMYFREDSDRVRWDAIERLGRTVAEEP